MSRVSHFLSWPLLLPDSFLNVLAWVATMNLPLGKAKFARLLKLAPTWHSLTSCSLHIKASVASVDPKGGEGFLQANKWGHVYIQREGYVVPSLQTDYNCHRPRNTASFFNAPSDLTEQEGSGLWEETEREREEAWDGPSSSPWHPGGIG